MKKLLSALFILGSVAALAETDLSHGGGNGGGNPSDCYTSACKVEEDMYIKVQIPTQLKIKCLENINLGKWCGTKTIKGEASYNLEGEENAKVKVSFKEEEVEFKKKTKDGNHGAGFYAKMSLDSKHKILDDEGKADGIVKATLNPVDHNVKLKAGGEYLAKATLIAEYDSF